MEGEHNMKTLKIVPTIHNYESTAQFCEDFKIGSRDLVITSKHTYIDYFEGKAEGAKVIFLRDFGQGEPTDDMVEKIYREVEGYEYDRVVGIGGGSILDVSKLFALETTSPIVKVFLKEIPAVKKRKLVLVPTTCGTGSEVTNVSILTLNELSSKFGLAEDCNFADDAVLIPELLNKLPFQFFATSSIDAFIHAIESYLSPRASRMSKMYSIEAMKTIIPGYLKIAKEGPDARFDLLEDFLYASLYAGIAFGHAGTGAVHAMSYPFSAAFHVAHGEANYVFFSSVFKFYQAGCPEGKIKELNQFLADLLGCESSEVYEKLDELFNQLLKKKSLKEYGMKEEQIVPFTTNVIEKQQRLMKNTYFPMDAEMVEKIYRGLYEA